MRHLIILNHQPDIPPFMVSQILYAKDHYGRVSYVNTRRPVNASLFDACENVSFHYPGRLGRIAASVVACLRFFGPMNLKQAWAQIREQGLDFSYLKQLFLFLASDACTRPLAGRLIRQGTGTDSVTVLSTWFGACAVTAARLKRRWPQIRAFSMAHSFEILVSRNRFLPYLFNPFKFNYLDGVVFIAEKMREAYFEGVGKLDPACRDKTHVCYLGSYKDPDTLNPQPSDVFHICTCSRVIPLKRLDLLCKALRNWKGGRIRWTHLGDGEMMDTLRSLSEETMRENPNVEIVLKGQQANDEVKAFYASVPIDLFCNLSTIEGLPISIMEAVSYGIPVMATNVGGTSEIVDSGIGVLLDADINAERVRDALLSFSQLPEIRKALMREAAYARWQDRFDAQKNLSHFFELIQ